MQVEEIENLAPPFPYGFMIASCSPSRGADLMSDSLDHLAARSIDSYSVAM
jgi:hypothetical protein